MFSCLSPCHHPLLYFSESHPKRVSFLYQPSAFHHTLFANDLLLPKFIQELDTDRAISTKNTLLVPCDSAFDSFFIQFRRGIFNSFAFSSNDVLFIYYFVAPNQVTKICFCLFSTPQIIHHHHSTCCIAGFLHQCIYTSQHILANGSFNFACRQSRPLTLPLHCNTCCWNILTIKICFNVFFPHCQLTIDVFTFSFSWFCYQFSNSCG